MSSLERCPLFRVPFIERFHCIQNVLHAAVCTSGYSKEPLATARTLTYTITVASVLMYIVCTLTLYFTYSWWDDTTLHDIHCTMFKLRCKCFDPQLQRAIQWLLSMTILWPVLGSKHSTNPSTCPFSTVCSLWLTT